MGRAVFADFLIVGGHASAARPTRIFLREIQCIASFAAGFDNDPSDRHGTVETDTGGCNSFTHQSLLSAETDSFRLDSQFEFSRTYSHQYEFVFEPAADGELDDEAVGIYAEPITGDPLALASALERIDDEMRTLPDRGPDRAAARARRRHGK